jgi:cytochrome c-type biogenesis protein CcmE
VRITNLRWWIAAGVCLAAVAWLLAVALTSNIEYFRTASEAVANRGHDGTSTFRLAGAVVPGSVHAVSGGVDFQVTDGHATVEVHHLGDPPNLFKPGAPVVVEGHWSRLVFDSDRILIKHGAQYRPPSVTPQVSASRAPAAAS